MSRKQSMTWWGDVEQQAPNRWLRRAVLVALWYLLLALWAVWWWF